MFDPMERGDFIEGSKERSSGYQQRQETTDTEDMKPRRIQSSYVAKNTVKRPSRLISSWRRLSGLSRTDLYFVRILFGFSLV